MSNLNTETGILLRLIHAQMIALSQAWDVPLVQPSELAPLAPKAKKKANGATKRGPRGPYGPRKPRSPLKSNGPDTARRGAAWTPKEDKILKTMRRKGRSYAACAAVLGRTPEACNVRHSWLSRNT